MSAVSGSAQSGERVSTEVLTPSSVRRVACMLDLDPSAIQNGENLPLGWHFIAMPASTPHAELRSDGFPGLGVTMPDLGLPRLMLAGRSVAYHSDLKIGEEVLRRSWIDSIEEKGDSRRPMAIARIEHELRSAASGEIAVTETQNFILLPAGSSYKPQDREAVEIKASVIRTHVPDSMLLFQYSALGFNSHKIHLDRAFARDVEGFPDLVVNGGLATLLLTEFIRLDLGLTLRSLKIRNTAPLFCDRPLTLAADEMNGRWALSIHNEIGEVAAQVEVETA
jgi:3-methylfumaryl-CoA hydratase